MSHPHMSHSTHTHLAWSISFLSGCSERASQAFIFIFTGHEWCLGLGSDWVPWELLPWCEPGRVWVFHGWPNTEEHSGLPSLSAWKANPQWSPFHLYELHRHSDRVLKMGVAPSQCGVLSTKDSSFVANIYSHSRHSLSRFLVEPDSLK